MTFRNGKKAVTLVELMAVIAIMGIVATISLGFIRAYRPAISLYTASRELRETLEEARSRTIAEQAVYGVRFSEAEAEYELVRLAGGVEVIDAFSLPEGITFDSITAFDGAIARFNTAGAADESGAVVLLNASANQRTVTINPSGYIAND